MLKEEFFNEKIICLDVEANNNEEVMKKLGQMLIKNKYIDASYVQSVILREKSFPTGLALANTGIAIPHATPENNVFKNGMAAVRLKTPVQFNSMEDPEKKIDANLVFMLALSEVGEHLGILKRLFTMFQNEELVKKLQKSNDKETFFKVLANSLMDK
ncbi:PTS sugar transporter subunit IIA [Pectinatus cerevisiiphilus]|uniref:PTS system IIA component (Gat family) n=1 Tax=Pectinatus cerevisiiphilus TaxID=86956 RepID=A0A4R3KFN8_9FIRM|nr:PTS sugar transporter subunit IIA [Pectinatus cerevisiiphilus]TCS81955.1 PTS system IIA component (Gat family) [Pectinatus cerevisiiphilus]